MPHIELPESIAAELHELAEQDHRAVQELVDEAISGYIVQRHAEPELSASEIDSLKRGIAQLNRGEGIPGEQMSSTFAEWRKRRASS